MIYIHWNRSLEPSLEIFFEPYLQEERSEYMIENLANNLIGSFEQKFIWPDIKISYKNILKAGPLNS